MALLPIAVEWSPEAAAPLPIAVDSRPDAFAFRPSAVLAPFRERYFITGELNTRVSDVDVKLRELEERFGPEGEVSHLDGVSVDADDWHFNVRPSNTEPLLRLNLEARSEELMARADQSLYRAKKEGRARVCKFEPVP